MTTPTLPIEYLRVSDLKRHPDNPRLGSLKDITESIRKNGWHGVLVAQESTGHILVGNHRYEAVMELYAELGPDEWHDVTGLPVDEEGPFFPVHRRDVTDTQALRILLADNRAGDMATYDEERLVAVLQMIVEDETEALKEAGKTEEEIQQLTMDALAGTGFTPADTQAIEEGLKVDAPEQGSKGTPEETLEQYENTQLRQITLILDVWEYGPVIDTLGAIREREKLDTNKDAVLKVLTKDKAGKDLFERIEQERAKAESEEAGDDAE
jgi:ParB-like chromosome segregation protein Spo0J